MTTLTPQQQMIFEETLEKVRLLAAKVKTERLGRFTTSYSSHGSLSTAGSQLLGTTNVPAIRPRQTVEVYVPIVRASLVVGPGAETLKRLEKMSGASIQLDQSYHDGEQRRFLVTGLPEDIEEAKRLIVDKPLNFSSLPSVNLSVPQVRVGLVIGKGGETIREIQEKSGAKVVIAPDLAANSAAPLGRRDVDRQRVITIVGEQSAMEKARDMIEEIVFGAYRSGASSCLSTIKNSAFMQIPEMAVGTVIGKRAETMKGIQETTGARLFIEPSAVPGTSMRNVYLQGTPEQMAMAQSLITEKVRRVDPTFGLYDANSGVGGMDGSLYYGSLPYQNVAAGMSTSAEGVPAMGMVGVGTGAYVSPDANYAYNAAYPTAAAYTAQSPAAMQTAMDPTQITDPQQQQQLMEQYAAYYAHYYNMDPATIAAYYAQYSAMQRTSPGTDAGNAETGNVENEDQKRKEQE